MLGVGVGSWSINQTVDGTVSDELSMPGHNGLYILPLRSFTP